MNKILLNDNIFSRTGLFELFIIAMILCAPTGVLNSYPSNNSSDPKNVKLNNITDEDIASLMMFCTSAGNDANYEHISNVQLAGINNNSNAQGYSDFTSISTDLQAGEIYTITITPTWPGTVYNEGYGVWIDINQDGDFLDADEQVALIPVSSNTPVTGTFLLSSISTLGPTTMRVSMKYDGIPTPCETFDYGEVEDYTVNILAPEPVLCNTECTTPYYFSWYDGVDGAQWPITNGEATVQNVYTISGAKGDYNVTVTLDNPDTQNIDFANCATSIDRAYTATCLDPNGTDDCDGNAGTSDSQFSYGCGYLTFGVTSNTSAEYTSITYEFEYPSYICGLEIGDIDYSGASYPNATSYQDEVDVVADSMGFPVIINAVSGPAVNVFNNNTTSVKLLAEYTNPYSGDILPNDPAGHAYISTPNRVTSITFTYSNGPADDGQSDDHAIRLAGFDFCPTSQIEVCENGIDDNANGYIDSFDPDCPLYAPFDCDKSMYQSLSTDNGSTYQLYDIETDPVAFNEVYDLTSNGMNASGFNALAFNPVDRFIYGINPLKTGNSELYMINSLSAIQYVGNITGLTGTNDAGCMGSDGTYYVTGLSEKLFEVNVATRIATEIIDLGFAGGDIAMNPENGLLYIWNTDASQLYSVDPNTGASSAIGSPDQYDEFGALYFNEQGDIIAYGDDRNVVGTDQETLVKIDPVTGVVTPIGTGPDTRENDGCSCAFGVALTKEGSAVTIGPGDAFSYTFTIYNRTGTALSNVTFQDILPAGLTYGSNPYNITGLSLGSPSINGSSSASFVISNIAPGSSNSFTVDINIPSDFCDNITNQATLSNLPSEFGTSIVSDDPNTAEINDPTITTVSNCEEYWMEAECENIGANWNIVDDPTASRGKYAIINSGFNSLGSAPTGVNDRIRFNVNILNPGNYNIFARVFAPTSNDDSFWVRANGGTWYKWNSLSGFASAGWEWGQVYNSDAGSALVTFPLVSGANTIDIAYREDGARLDKIKVTLSDELPTGEGGISQNCPEICDNGLDDDGDGLTDCEDDDCSSEVYCQGPCDAGKLFVERWFGINGSFVSDLTSNADYPNSPDEIDYIKSFQGPTNYGDNYGTRVRGFIIPSETGTYTFNVTGDDNTILYLSTDVEEPNKSEIASVTGWTNITQHDKYAVQTSSEVELVANVWYYVEVLVKEGTGGDHFQVYWQTPSVPSTWTIVPGANLAPFICPEICDNGEDDDGDGLDDCLDPDCGNGINVDVTSADNVICVGETATLNAGSLGTPGSLTYAWSGGGGSSSTATVSPATTTNYVVTVTNTNGCTATDQIQVTVNDLPAASAANNGSITCVNTTVQLTAGPAGMTYAWSGGGTGQTKNVTSPGTYTVTVTDSNGCSATSSTTVTGDNTPPNANAGLDQTICIGESVLLIATGGGTYLWENNATSDRITVNPSVTTDYSVTVTAANGCTDVDIVRVIVNPLPIASVAKDGDLQCNNLSVQLTASPAGLNYVWSTTSTSQVITVSTSGTYSVTVTDGNGCSDIANITVNENFTNPVANAGSDVSICNGESTNLSASGGGAYAWSNGLGSDAAVTVNPSATTTYTVTVTASNGCTDTDQVTVTVIPLPVANISASSTICEETAVSISASNAGAGASYTWNFGPNATPQTATGIGPHNVSYENTNSNGSNLQNNIQLDVTLNGCSSQDQQSILIRANPKVTVSSTPPSCGVDNGTITFTFGDNAARTNIDFSINGGVSFPYGTSDNVGSFTVSNLPSGSYDLYTIWGNGECPLDLMEVTLGDNTVPTANAGSDESICNGENTNLTATGVGTYAWSNGLGSNATINVSPSSTTTYTVTVTGSNGCTDTDQVTVTVIPLPVANINAASVTCEATTVSISASNAGSGASYAWNFGANATPQTATGIGPHNVSYDNTNVSGNDLQNTIQLDVTLNGCSSQDQTTISIEANPEVTVSSTSPSCGIDDGTITFTFVNNAFRTGIEFSIDGGVSYPYNYNDNSNSATVSNLPSGSYDLYVRWDNDECPVDLNNVILSDNTVPNANAGSDESICIGFSTDLTATGVGTYAWSNGLGSNATVTVNPVSRTTYTVTVTGSNGCTDTDNVTIRVNPLPVVSASNNGPITCALPNVTLTALPAGMAYVWQGGGSNQTKIVSATGTYSVTVTDSNGCTAIASTTVTDDLTPPTANAGSDGSICDGESTDLTATGGGTYTWSNGLESNATVTVSPTTTTTYTVTVTASNGCTDTDQVTVTVIPLPVANINAASVTCEETTISVSATNAGAGATYSWNFGANATPQTATGIGPHNVSYENINASGNDLQNTIQLDVILNGCFNQDQNTISIEANPEVTVSSTPPSCGIDDGAITFTFGNNTSRTNIEFSIDGGASYPYNYNDNIGSATISNLPSGSYDLYVRWDNDECPIDLNNITFGDNTVPDANAGSDESICIGFSADLTATGVGTYAWSNGLGSNAMVTVSPVSTTTYTLTVTGANGCTDTDNVTITVNPLPVVSASNNGPITCALPNVTLTALPAGMTYAWQGGGNNQTKIVSATGTYSVTVTDSNGCTAITSTTVTDDLTPPTANAGDDDLICEGFAIDLTASGGVSYQWSNGAGNTATVSVSPAVTTTYTVTVTAANGCTDTDDVTVSVDSKPVVGVIGSDLICIQTTTTLSPSSGGTWQSSDNSIAIVSSSGVVYGLNPGTATFTFTSSITGCPSDATAEITVTPDLSVDIGYSGGICIEDDTQLTANVTGGTLDFTYSWEGPNGFTASTQTIDVDESGNYYITVTDLAGCSDNSSAYIYTAYDPFIFTLNTEVCEDESVTLSVNSATAVSYQWSANAGSAITQSVVVSPGLPSENYYVTVTNDIGCTTEATVHIDVKPKTPVTLGGTNEICIGETTNLSPTTGGTWISSNNSIAGVTNDGTVTGLSAGTVTFTFLDNTTNCESNPTLPVTIFGRPTVDVTGPDVICEGDNTVLSPTTGGTWSSNNTSLATVTDDGVVTALSSGSVSFVYTNSTTGCASNATTNITINPTYTTTFTGPSSVCLGESTYLSPTTGGTWASNDVSIATVSNIGVVTTVGSGSTTFTFTSDYSCVSGATAPLTVIPNDVITISGDSELCEDDVIILTASAPNGTWSSSNNSIATINSSGEVTGIAYGSATITYTHDPNTCANDPTFNLTIREKPTVSVSGPVEICAGEITSVAASGTGGTWSSSDESIAIVSVDGTVVGMSEGSATFSYTATNACESDATIPIRVNPAVDVNIEFIGSICLEDDTKIVADVSGGTSNFTYSWSGPGGFNSNQDTIDVPLSGLYNVLVTDAAGCSTNKTAYVYEAYNPFIFTLDTEICEGEDITLSINGSSSGTFQWSANAGSATTQSVTLTPSVPGDTYYVTITSPEGCTTVANAVINVEAIPVPVLTGSDNICVGSTTTFTPSTGGLWASSDYSVASISNAGVVYGLSPGAVSFTFRDTSTGCYSAATRNITINPNENILISGDNELCMGVPEMLTPSVAGGSWSSSNTSIVTVSSAGQITPVSAGSANVMYQPVANTCYNVALRPINVNNTPSVNINGPSTICAGEITYLVPSNGGVWVSDDTSVATVSNIGIVTGVSGGSASFTFTSAVGCIQNLSTPITIIPNPTVSLTGPASICINSTTTLSPTSGGIWLSSNNNVATVNSSGVVLGKNPGVVEFTFIEFTNGCTTSDVIEVTVNSIPTVTGLADDNICIGSTTNISPSSGGFWISNNPSVATITNSGLITGIGAGAATFTYSDGSSGCVSETSAALIVDGNPTINITGETELCVGDNSSILPNSGGTWSSSDVSIATINSSGNITAISAGDVTFTFSSNNTGCSSNPSDVFTVNNPTSATISGPTNICIGTVVTLTGSTTGTWESSNAAIASINNSGVLTANAPGIVTVTLNTTASCITNPTFDILVEPKPNPAFTGSSSICLGESTTLSPSSGGVWTSSNEAVATIDNSGNVTSVSSGVAIFTYTDNTTGCSSTTSTSLNIFNIPSINLVGNSSICIGESTSMSPSSGGVWTSSDVSIATIDPSGSVNGISAGSVTFTFVESGTLCSSVASQPITILPRPSVAITGVSSLCVGGTSSLSPTSGGSWISNNEAVAKVNDLGVVSAVGQGIARFTFVSDEGCASVQTSPIVVYGLPSITVDGPSELCVGENVQLLPSSGGTWTSSDNTIATILNDGLVTSIAQGTVTFIYTDAITGCISAESEELTVSPIPSTGVNGPTDICIGATTNLTPTTGGVWSSVDPTVATIENNGEITGIASGSTRFIFTHLGTGCVSDTSTTISVTSESIPVFTGSDEICIGDTSYITPAIGGTWESTNEAVATISNSGMIIGKGQGTSRFRFINGTTGCISSFSSSIKVNGIGTVFVDGEENICIGSATTLSPNSGGTWVSLNPSIASVSASGMVTGVSSGTAFFVFTDSDTGCSSDGTLDVVVQNATTVDITGESEVCIGYTTNLLPSSGGFWTSNNKAIATITNSGVVTGRAPGKVTFTFTKANSNCVIGSTSDSITVQSCKNHDFNVGVVNEEFFGNLSTNDNFPAIASYNNTLQLISKPNASIANFIINSDGSYSFKGNKPGNYRYNVPICMAPKFSGCPTTMIEITLVENQYSTGNPVTNLDIATMFGVESLNKAETSDGKFGIKSIQNDVCIFTLGCDMDWSSAWIDAEASNGLAEVKTDGIIEYTPNAEFIGFDTIYYGMCADGYSNCNSTMQIITVNHATAVNSVVASDDFKFTLRGSSVSGNVLENDSDAEGDSISVVAQGSLISPIVTGAGEYYIDALGNFNFTPNDEFSGHTEIVYEICDNNVNQACMQATLHLLVFNDIAVKLRVYLQGALMQNGNAVSAIGRPLMRDNLRVSPYTGKNYLPLLDPYSIAADPFASIQTKFNKIGPGLLTENREITDSLGVFSVTGDNAIVDWIHVELRSKSDYGIPIATRSGLLQRDGDVVDLDGVSDLRFNAVNVDSFYVVIKHRSHLGAMSEKVFYADMIDFTSPTYPVFNFGVKGLSDFTGLTQNNNVINGYSALWAGDFDANGKIKFTNPGDDQNVLFVNVLFTSPDFLINYDQAFGYMTGDYNMNSKTKYTNPSDDINYLFSQILLYPLNTSFLSNYNSLIEQIPDSE